MTTRRPSPGLDGGHEGEVYWNSADRQFGVFDTGAVDLIAVRYWVQSASYEAGDFVVNEAEIWRANFPIAAGALFNPAQWTPMSAAAGFLPLEGGTLTGPLVLFGPPNADLEAVTRLYLDEGFLPLTAGVESPLTGLLYLPATMPTLPIHAANKAYVDQQIATIVPPPPDLSAYLPLTAGPTAPLTGQLHLPAAAPTLPEHATDKAYVDAADQALQDQIALFTANLLFVGGCDVPGDQCTFTVASGLANGPLPAPATSNTGFYVIVTVTGAAPATGTEIPPGNYTVGDWIVSSGAQWVQLPIGQAAVAADQVAINPPIGTLGANVQTGLTALEVNKVPDAPIDMTSYVRRDAVWSTQIDAGLY